MGGSIGLTLREPDGKEHRMCRWTNALNFFVNNLKLVNKDNSHIEDILKYWYEMREDYELHKEDGNFEFEMTDAYAPFPYLAPMDYGLVVVDMVNDQILSYQGHTSFGRIAAVSVLNAMQNPDPHPDPQNVDEWPVFGEKAFYLENSLETYSTEAVIFREFFEAGRIEKASQYSNAADSFVDIYTNGQSFDDLVEIIKIILTREFLERYSNE